MYEQIIIKGGYVEEDGLIVEEEFGEKGEVLSKELVLFAVDFVDCVEVTRVNWSAGR